MGNYKYKFDLKKFFFLQLGVVVHVLHPRTWEAEVGESMRLRRTQPSLDREFQVSWAYREALSQKNK